MIITPIPHGLENLVGTSGPRTPGLHMSHLISAFYEDTEPERYRRDDDPTRQDPSLLFEAGLVFEGCFEEAIQRRYVSLGGQCDRPDELTHEEDGLPPILYNPDLLIFENGIFRVGEIKLTWKSNKGVPRAEGELFPPKFSKYECVTPSTTILTSDLRYVEAGSVKVGDSLIAFDETATGSKRHMVHTTVRAVRTIQKPCVRLELEDGTVTTCSDDHQWYGQLANSTLGWLSTNSLLASDETTTRGRLGGPLGRPRQSNSSICRVFPSEWKTCLSEYERGWLAGILDGEGSLHRSEASHSSFSLSIAQNPGPVLERILDLLEKDHFSYSVYRSDNCINIHIKTKNEMMRLLAVARPLRLLKKFAHGTLPGLTYDKVKVVNRSPIRDTDVIAIETDAHTYIAGGLASHNCQLKLYCRCLHTLFGRLIIYFVNRDWKKRGLANEMGPELLAWDYEFTRQELDEEWNMIIGHGRGRGII